MTKKRFKLDEFDSEVEMLELINTQLETISDLEKDVDYWKQVASQYSNELNVFEHCKKYKTECKNIYWRNNK